MSELYDTAPGDRDAARKARIGTLRGENGIGADGVKTIAACKISRKFPAG